MTRVAALQMVSGPDVAANLAVARALIAEAVAAGAALIALPEYFALLSPDPAAKLALSEAFPDPNARLQAFLAGEARRHGVWIVGGTIALASADPDRVRNSALVFAPDGRCVARYDKLHLFGFSSGDEHYDEACTIEAGSEVVAFDGPCGRIGLAVCYDLRFPELFRALGDVSLVVLSAAFTETTGRAHWEVLLRARAIENQCYVLASAQGGEHPGGRRTFGHSMLIDPWGQVLARQAAGPGIVIGEIDLERIAAVRESLPALRHRRL
jgi:nitrilase